MLKRLLVCLLLTALLTGSAAGAYLPAAEAAGRYAPAALPVSRAVRSRQTRSRLSMMFLLRDS